MKINKKYLDPGIAEAVMLLNQYGFETFESCEGGVGHAFPNATVRFYGDEFDCIRAYELCSQYNMNVLWCRRVFQKQEFYDKHERIELGINWRKPFNEIIFLKHLQTGTIYLPGPIYRSVHT